MTWHGMAWHAWYGMAWHGLEWHTWRGMAEFVPEPIE